METRWCCACQRQCVVGVEISPKGSYCRPHTTERERNRKRNKDAKREWEIKRRASPGFYQRKYAKEQALIASLSHEERERRREIELQKERERWSRPENRAKIEIQLKKHLPYMRRWCHENRDKIAAYRKTPRGKQISRLASSTRRARIAGVLRTLRPSEWEAIIMAAAGRCFYCKKKRPLTMDHVIPISKGGAHAAWNIVPACRSCNSSKGTRLVMLV